MDEKPIGQRTVGCIRDVSAHARHLAQLSLRQLADLTKVSNPYLSQIERGLHRPSIAIIKSLAEALNLSTSDLLAHAADIATDEESATHHRGGHPQRPVAQRRQKSALLAVYRSMVDAATAAGPPPGHRHGPAPSRRDAPTARHPRHATGRRRPRVTPPPTRRPSAPAPPSPRQAKRDRMP